MKRYGEEHYETLREASNYAASLVGLHRHAEARSLLRKTIPVARRVLGESDDLTLRMRSNYVAALVNAGIAAGDGSGVRHASNYLGLVARYVTLVVANAWRTRGPLRIISLLCVVGAAWTASAAARTEHGDDCPLAQ